jgi:hypothetical protein
MRITDAFPSDYLKAADLQGREITAAMSIVKMEAIGRDKDMLPVLYFQGKAKGLVLNKTNANTIVSLYGDDTDNWTGSEILLYEAMVEFQGKMGPAIRVRAPRRNTNMPSQSLGAHIHPPLKEVFPGEPSDDIPF